MTWWIVGSLVVVLGVGVVVARWWWQLAAGMAPYRDELEARAQRQRQAGGDDHVVVIRPGDLGPSSKPPASSAPPAPPR